MALSLNAKLASFFIQPHPEFTVAHAPVQQSSAPEDASRFYAEGEFTFSKLRDDWPWFDTHMQMIPPADYPEVANGIIPLSAVNTPGAVGGKSLSYLAT